MKIETREITSETTPVKSDGMFVENRAYNYLWELINLGDFIPAFSGMRIVKNGFARYTYSDGTCGVESRIKQTLAQMATSFGIPQGKLIGVIKWVMVDDYDTTLSAEQFFHSKNVPFRIGGLFRDLKVKGKRPLGGHSEFFNMPDTKSVRAKFANAWRKPNLAKGLEIVERKRRKGIHGCPVWSPSLPNYEVGL